ncbi:hypothetical protein, partial [Streptomyces albus]|uniref:hypothetical protein n=1 Tax=Streptomyces albus TaxID=1888 RepID=UPI001A9AA6A4
MRLFRALTQRTPGAPTCALRGYGHVRAPVPAGRLRTRGQREGTGGTGVTLAPGRRLRVLLLLRRA